MTSEVRFKKLFLRNATGLLTCTQLFYFFQFYDLHDFSLVYCIKNLTLGRRLLVNSCTPTAGGWRVKFRDLAPICAVK